MSIFGFLMRKDINEGVREFENTTGSVLVDVRTREEYDRGHIEKSVNMPLDRLDAITVKVEDKNTPVFVYCLSGARSGQAERILRRLGYKDVRNIGGIASYCGKVVR